MKVNRPGVRRTLILGVAALMTGLLSAIAPAAPPPNALQATVEPYPTGQSDRSYPAKDGAGTAIAPIAWRVVSGTGNCCENYLAATRGGRLMDFGGATIRYTDDTGRSWNEVSSLANVGAEGAVVEAPGGDVVGVTWDPYTGDRLEAFKYEAASGKWYYAQNSLHQPFFDRPYVTVVPGPFQIGGTTVPYITYMLGGWPQKTTYLSTDGLNYVPATSPTQPVGTPKSQYLTVTADPATDWLQPLTVPAIAPLAGGGALAWQPGSGDVISLYILQPPSTTWSPFTFPGAPALKGRLLADSAGRLHNVSITTRSVHYQVSPDGGKTWSSSTLPLPDGYEAVSPAFDRFWDFKTNASLNMAAVSLYARDAATGKDQNLVMVVSTPGGKPQLDKVLLAGKGDKSYGTGLGAADRLDFITVAILPDGRIATTFMDSESSTPVVAITALPQSPSGDGTPTPSPSTSSTFALTPTPEPSSSLPDPYGSPATDLTSPRITAVSDRPDPITPNGDGRRDRTRIRFTISEAAHVTISILKDNNRRVRTIRSSAFMGAGPHTAWWNGLDGSGRRVRGGTYFYEIIAVDAAGNQDQTTEGTITVRR